MLGGSQLGSVLDGLPKMSNFCCLPGKAGGFPIIIKRGGDKFIFVGDESGSTITGISGGSIYSRNDQSMVVKMMTPEDPNINEALFAREILGPKWVEVVAAGIPDPYTHLTPPPPGP